MAKISDIKDTDYIGFIWDATRDKTNPVKTKWACIQLDNGEFIEIGIDDLDDLAQVRQDYGGYGSIKEMLSKYYSPKPPTIAKILRFSNEWDLFEWLKQPL